MTDQPVTPTELRQLATRAEALADDVAVLHARLHRAGDSRTRRIGFRLDEAVFSARHVGGELKASADDLTIVQDRSDCAADWGACPEHGDTLTGLGGRSWCEATGCARRWDYNRTRFGCTEPGTYLWHKEVGEVHVLCAGHAHAAREQLTGAVTTRRPAA